MNTLKEKKTEEAYLYCKDKTLKNIAPIFMNRVFYFSLVMGFVLVS